MLVVGLWLSVWDNKGFARPRIGKLFCEVSNKLVKKCDEFAFFLKSSCLKKALINLREELIDESRELTHSEQN